MRDFTQEEKGLIVNTPITMDCFEMDNFIANEALIISKEAAFANYWFFTIIPCLEKLRQLYNETKDERLFIELIRLLPNSYKVVKL